MGERRKKQPENAVLFHHPDAVDTSREQLMGRHAAGEGFLNGFIRYADVERFFCQGSDPVHGEDFARRVTAFDTRERTSTFVPVGMMGRATEIPGTLMLPSPSLSMFAWRRRISATARSYSLCGVTHTLASDNVMDELGELLTAPVQPWDAVICTSLAAKTMINRLLDNWADYLARRSGGRFKSLVQLPVIPLGVDCRKFEQTADTDAARVSIRRGLGIADDDVVFLYFGRLSFHAKAHPMPMYLALEATAARCGQKIHLLQVGRFPNDGVEREFRDGVRRYCPSVNGIFLDGRDAAVCRQVWFAADVFTSLSDNIQETFGLTVIEAMAAGLPVVVSDWDGYRDTVRHGEDGFRIATWLPLPDSGSDIAIQLESALDPVTKDRAYNHYCGYVSQSTCVDIAATADAYIALAKDPVLRRRMGASAQTRARQEYDWSIVIRKYQDLWVDLSSRRKATMESAPTVQGRPVYPLRDDPFSLFANYSTRTIDGDALVRIAPADPSAGTAVPVLERLRRARAQSMNNFAADIMLAESDITAVVGMIEREGCLPVISLAEPLAESVRFRLPRTLGWLAKIGLIQLEAVLPTPSESPAEDTPLQQDAQSLADLGAAARSRGALEAAADYFMKALDVDPDHAQANFHYGELLALSQQYDHAVTFLGRATKNQPGFTEAGRSLSKVLFLKGDDKQAIQVLEGILEQAPGDPESHYLLGVGYRRSGVAENAISHLELVLREDPGRVDALAHLALARKSLGRREAAIEAISRGLKLEPANVFARALMASLQTEGRGKGNISRVDGGMKVGFHLNQVYQFPLLKPLFDGFAENHWPLITGDGRELLEFDPDVVIICDSQAESLRRLVPNARLVNIGAGLTSKRFHASVSDAGDFMCVSSPFVREQLVKRFGLSAARIWTIGYPPMDALFMENDSRLPLDLTAGQPTVLYAPTHNPGLSSALLLADHPVDRLLGDLTDVNLVIKPHPRLCQQRPGLIDGWKRAVEGQPNVWLVTDGALDVAPFLQAADVLVSDASSVIFEYLALDRPIVVIDPAEHPQGSASFDPEGIEWIWRDCAFQVSGTNQLAGAVRNALQNPNENSPIRRQYAEKLFGNLTDGNARGRLIAHIENLMRS